jgi:RNA polymerase sigma factor (sigma-70 family)
MAETPEFNRESAKLHARRFVMAASDVNDWFVREVLPLEQALMQYLRHNWRAKGDIIDLRQEVYVRVLEAARKEIPERARQFVFSTARNLLIDRVRREQVVPIEAVSDLDALMVAMDVPGPERAVASRDELRHLLAAVDHLPPRCRQIFMLGKVEGLGGREIAARLGTTESNVSKQLAIGIRMLANILHSESAAGGEAS